ncbi:hypothetical protein AtNW77_Chr2g0221381 [Arabidopsis thaliana]|jgi:hypothetical protein|uniref:At2g01580 n=4 Tax=Arabidopsis TaxID=3701 RepID=Q9ZVE8_ARATH|nr:uncharacterized protein AT2G01580 [Arabidopsis thaliana]KAG7635538.1 hypothetical protein ISN45_At02g000590 [Arabidopsis thaliana x Arabidopsis arenosa]KAG7640184.1 hypothetical protein ISN44_As02g000560 [Arabidopsis suecica]AAC67334.1 hypothetical protein [Arabidopsis thaliana]AAR24218.1 At2g01580 [Arabidopsis thaliana]AAR92358.1 At2g01580 [Arabidopsis thaliana]|eukprot:NP_178267.1 transmembrane protein [Arabidopsis thaliana]
MADSDIETSSNQNSNSNTSHSTTSTTSVHVTALDGIVSANSLFTVAVFVGISFDQPSDLTLTDRTECSAGRDVERDLVVFEVISFAFFLFSSLVAQGMKLAINLLNSKETDEVFKANINRDVLRFGVVGAAGGSILGCVFLLLSIVDVIQLRLGLLSCGNALAIHTVLVLVVLVSSALSVYIFTVFYSFRK